MPVISATPHATLPYQLVVTDWADQSTVDCVQVMRVHTTSGLEYPLRAYIAPCETGEGCLLLSGGKAYFWDTEAPLDTQFYYEARPCGVDVFYSPGPPLVLDSYSRAVVNGWGTPDVGPAWTTSGGAAADYFVNLVGSHSHGSVNVSRVSSMTLNLLDFDWLIERITVPALPTGNEVELAFRARTSGGDFVDARIFLRTDNTVNTAVRQFVGGVDTSPGQVVVSGVTSTTPLSLRFQGVGNLVRVWVWASGTTQPVAATTSMTTTLLVTGNIEVRSILAPGNTNALPYVITYDNLSINPQALLPLTVATQPLTQPSEGNFWLKDPVRPCNDQMVVVDLMRPPNCPPGRGIYFLSMGTESRSANSIDLLPSNSPDLITLSRQRRKIASTLVLATRSFTDRDAMIQLLQPGGPLLFQAPPNYGIYDRYISVRDVAVDRGLPDVRYQPRIFTLPHAETSRPAGTTQGICGARVDDLCDLYPTWDDVTAAGLSYADLFTGGASGTPALAARTWLDVETEFANWAAVEANGTWEQLREGD